MKLSNIFLSILMGLLVLGNGCTDDILKEDAKSSLTLDGFYKDNNDLELAMGGVVLQFNGAFNQTWGAPYAGDDITSKNSGNKIGFSDIDCFKMTSSTDRFTNWWVYFYKTIKGSNTLINNYKRASLASEDERNRAGGLAYFYRATSYFFLTRTWGEIPLITEATVDKNRPNAKVKDIYTLIVSDLINAEKMLPDNWEGNKINNGINIYPNKGAAKALLANVYLTMGGWPLKETDKYALAATKAKEVIDNKATYGFDLEAINQLWQKRFTPETVFGCYYNNNISGWSWENGSQLAPRTFGCDEEGGWEDGYAELAFYNRFPAGPRKDYTYQKDYYLDTDGDKVMDDTVAYTALKAKHPFFLKYRYDNCDWATHRGKNWWGSATTLIIRYAEVLLTYAEAQARSQSPDANAYAAINEVRNRAGLSDLAPGLSQTDFIKAVVEERGWEFAGPEAAARWFDLLRTETLAAATLLRSPLEVPIDPANMPDDNTHKNYWMPIPIDN